MWAEVSAGLPVPDKGANCSARHAELAVCSKGLLAGGPEPDWTLLRQVCQQVHDRGAVVSLVHTNLSVHDNHHVHLQGLAVSDWGWLIVVKVSALQAGSCQNKLAWSGVSRQAARCRSRY